MPRGDAHRTWFPEMIETLRREWSPSLSDEALIELRDRLDERLQQIRAGRNILPPMFFGPRCEKRQRSTEPRVSARRCGKRCRCRHDARGEVLPVAASSVAGH